MYPLARSGIRTKAIAAVLMVGDACRLVAVAGRRSNLVTKAWKLDVARYQCSL